jgi:hypothetical protein
LSREANEKPPVVCDLRTPRADTTPAEKTKEPVLNLCETSREDPEIDRQNGCTRDDHHRASIHGDERFDRIQILLRGRIFGWLFSHRGFWSLAADGRPMPRTCDEEKNDWQEKQSVE